jgi:hypothetical protein
MYGIVFHPIKRSSKIANFDNREAIDNKGIYKIWITCFSYDEANLENFVSQTTVFGN